MYPDFQKGNSDIGLLRRKKIKCRYCKVEMIPGTTYRRKRNKNDKGCKRFHECPKCKDKVYTNTANFQEMLERTIES